ncbi:MAG: TIR domain-containing protein [Aeromicrobium sp.]|uniref:toll/interleukin-1 receptor domain-containing protein n=1 Tax=Aeromicrobium sp. TaxID=1871063 RepID=UPI0039E32A30
MFFDERAIRDMDDWQHRILVGLRESRVLLVCLSPAYLRSEWCRREWTEYLRRHARDVGGTDTVAALYCVEVGDPDPGEVAEWKAEIERMVQQTDVRPWFPQGREALAEHAVRERLALLGDSLAERMERARRSEKTKGNLKRFDEYFVGRVKELRALRSGLADKKIGLLSVVSGLGGIGKTELTTTYAHAYRHAYPAARGRSVVRARPT